MSDPFAPSRSFDAIAADLPLDIETEHADRAAQFFSERPHLAAGRTVTLAAIADPGEEDRQLVFLKELPVDSIATVNDIPPEREAAVDAIVEAWAG